MLKIGKSLAVACVLTVVSPDTGQAQDGTGIVDRLRTEATKDQALGRSLQQLDQQVNGQGQDLTLRRLYKLYYQAAPNENLTMERLSQQVAIGNARKRVSLLTNYLIADLNADWVISKSERDAFSGRQAAALALLFARGDTDQDDTITHIELLNFVEEQASPTRSGSQYTILKVMDVNQDGVIEVDEIEATVSAISTTPLNLKRQKDGQIMVPESLNQD